MIEQKRKPSPVVPANKSQNQQQADSNALTAGTAVALVKRTKTEIEDVTSGISEIMRTGPKRTSGLQAPIMHLTGHSREITSCRFSPSGEHIASGSADAKVFLWNTYGECGNYGVLQGHKSGVLEVQWMPGGERLVTASADKTVAIWDAQTGERLRRGKRHTAAVNSCCPLSCGTGDDNLFASASDDGTAYVWDARERHPVAELDNSSVPLTSVVAAPSGNTVYTGCLDNNVTAWDIRTLAPVQVLRGHSDTVMGLAISPKTGNYLLSTSLDSSVRLWDLRPYCRTANRCERVFTGAPHGFEKNLIRPAFNCDESMAASGSVDRTLTVWNMRTGEIKYKLPGHKGCVTQVDFHPKEPIVLSGSIDKTMFLGEI